jgi:hypothetical protein
MHERFCGIVRKSSFAAQVRVYSPESLHSELEAAARRFCSERVRVDLRPPPAGSAAAGAAGAAAAASGGGGGPGPEVTLPRLFGWYRKDFGGSAAELLQWVRGFVPASVAAQLGQAALRRDVRVVFE